MRVFGFRTAFVFDHSQTDGEPLPEFSVAEGDPQHYTAHLKQFLYLIVMSLSHIKQH